MSLGEARRIQSAISSNVIKKQGTTSTQRSTKRLREDTEHLTLEILISNSSSSTIIKKKRNINSNLLTAAPQQNHNTDGLAIKLNRLKEKSARYNSHSELLSKYIQENLVPKGLETTLEPTIGKFDQEFVDNWYTNLNQVTVVLMKQTAAYRDKAEQKTQKALMKPKQS